MNTDLDNLSIGAFAKAAGIGVETIRFYQRRLPLLEPIRPPGGIRRHGRADMVRVKFIKSAQRVGSSLDEIIQLLTLEDGTHCNEAAQFAAQQLANVRVRLKNLKRMETVLSRLVAQCESHHDTIACPLIASLHGS